MAIGQGSKDVTPIMDPKVATTAPRPRRGRIRPVLGTFLVCMGLAATRPAHAEVFAVFGDSLAKGMASILDPSRVLDLATVGYGLTQPNYRVKVDWAAAAVARYHVHRMLIMIGTNDTRPLPNGQGGACAVEAPCWKPLYAQRLREVSAEFAQAGAQIAWIGIPPMDKPLLDNQLRGVESTERGMAEADGQPFIGVEDLFSGRPSLHTPDHIHFRRDGYALLAGRAIYGLAALQR